jgi:hypothetical protein
MRLPLISVSFNLRMALSMSERVANSTTLQTGVVEMDQRTTVDLTLHFSLTCGRRHMSPPQLASCNPSGPERHRRYKKIRESSKWVRQTTTSNSQVLQPIKAYMMTLNKNKG